MFHSKSSVIFAKSLFRNVVLFGYVKHCLREKVCSNLQLNFRNSNWLKFINEDLFWSIEHVFILASNIIWVMTLDVVSSFINIWHLYGIENSFSSFLYFFSHFCNSKGCWNIITLPFYFICYHLWLSVPGYCIKVNILVNTWIGFEMFFDRNCQLAQVLKYDSTNCKSIESNKSLNGVYWYVVCLTD